MNISVGGVNVGKIVSLEINTPAAVAKVGGFEIDSDVKPHGIGTKARAKMHAKARGQFVKAGCSVAPRAIPKVRNTPWGKPVPKSVEAREPLALFLRRLKAQPATRRARDAARAQGIPSHSKD